MELEDTLKIQVNRYINKELSGVELAEFEALLKNDNALQKQVEFYKDVDATITASANSKKDFGKIANLLDDLGDEFIIGEVKIEEPILTSTTQPKATKSIIRYLIPLTVAAAAAFWFLPMLFLGGADTTDLADKYYQTYNVSFTTKSAATDLSDAEKFYNNEKWAVARDIFNKHPKNIKAQIAKANCEYQLQKYNNAIVTLKPIAIDDTDYSETANWYLSLAYLQMENKIQAITTLNKITSNSRFYKKAQKLIKQLD